MTTQDLDAAPTAGAEAAQTNTFAFGPMAPGDEIDAVWRVTPVRGGTFTVNYEVSAGLNGQAKATTVDGSPVEGSFVVTISTKPPKVDGRRRWQGDRRGRLSHLATVPAGGGAKTGTRNLALAALALAAAARRRGGDCAGATRHRAATRPPRYRGRQRRGRARRDRVLRPAALRHPARRRQRRPLRRRAARARDPPARRQRRARGLPRHLRRGQQLRRAGAALDRASLPTTRARAFSTSSYTNADGDTRVVEYRRSDSGNVADPDSAGRCSPSISRSTTTTAACSCSALTGCSTSASATAARRSDPDRNGAGPRHPARQAAAARPAGSNGQRSPEIYSYGLRNPWRFSFDRATGDLWIGDVGQDTFEEVDGVARGRAEGANFGWSAFEGEDPLQRRPSGSRTPCRRCSPTAHDEGGARSRAATSSAIPRSTSLYGRYLYGDYCQGELRSFTAHPGRPRHRRPSAWRPGPVAELVRRGRRRAPLRDLARGPVYRLRRGRVAERRRRTPICRVPRGANLVSMAGGTVISREATRARAGLAAVIALALCGATLTAGGPSAAAGTRRLLPQGRRRLQQPRPRRRQRRSTTTSCSSSRRRARSASCATATSCTSRSSTSATSSALTASRGCCRWPSTPTTRPTAASTSTTSTPSGDIRIDEFTRKKATRARASSRKKVIVVPHDQAVNHNGGQLQIGPDGYLYAGTGDGGPQQDPEDDAQDTGSLLGKILRIAPPGERRLRRPGRQPLRGRARRGRDLRARPAQPLALLVRLREWRPDHRRRRGQRLGGGRLRVRRRRSGRQLRLERLRGHARDHLRDRRDREPALAPDP